MGFEKVSINTDTIKIYLDNKDSIMLINKQTSGEGDVTYSYLGYWPKIKYHKYYPQNTEFNGSYWLINNRDGRRYEFFESEPKYNKALNPKGHPDFIASVKDNYHGLSKINIYEVKDTLNLVYTKEANRCWYFADLQWLKPTVILVNKVYNGDSPTKKYTVERIEFKKNKWVYQEELFFKENCEVDSTKRNGDK